MGIKFFFISVENPFFSKCHNNGCFWILLLKCFQNIPEIPFCGRPCQSCCLQFIYHKDIHQFQRKFLRLPGNRRCIKNNSAAFFMTESDNFPNHIDLILQKHKISGFCLFQHIFDIFFCIHTVCSRTDNNTVLSLTVYFNKSTAAFCIHDPQTGNIRTSICKDFFQKKSVTANSSRMQYLRARTGSCY